MGHPSKMSVQRLTLWTPPVCPISSVSPPRPRGTGGGCLPDCIAYKSPNVKYFAIRTSVDGGGVTFLHFGLQNAKDFAFVDVLFMADPPPCLRSCPHWFTHPPPPFDRTSLMNGPYLYRFRIRMNTQFHIQRLLYCLHVRRLTTLKKSNLDRVRINQTVNISEKKKSFAT